MDVRVDSKSERQISLQTWFSFDQPLCHGEVLLSEYKFSLLSPQLEDNDCPKLYHRPDS